MLCRDRYIDSVLHLCYTLLKHFVNKLCSSIPMNDGHELPLLPLMSKFLYQSRISNFPVNYFFLFTYLCVA